MRSLLHSRKKLAVLCVAAGLAGALLLDRWIHAHATRPPPSDGNYARLMSRLSSMKGGPAAVAELFHGKLELGSPAADFDLPAVHGPSRVELSNYRGKPVVLVLGSLSCIKLWPRVVEIEQLYQTHRNRAEFLFVNVTEAGHSIRGLEFLLEAIDRSAAAVEERRRRLKKAMHFAGLTMPAVVDVAEAAETAYDAFPSRLVIVDGAGKIALDLGRGVIEPWNLDEAGQWLREAREQSETRPSVSAGPIAP